MFDLILSMLRHLRESAAQVPTNAAACLKAAGTMWQAWWERFVERWQPTPAAVPAPIPADTRDSSLSSRLRPWRRAGWGVIVLFIGGTLLWSGHARLDSAAIAHGVVAVESSRKNIQHLEGGIVKAIVVRDGERVAAGQTLIQLDDTYARATLDLLNCQWAAAVALRARLIAEREGRDAVEFPAELLDLADKPGVGEAIMAQADAFEARREMLANQTEILDERVTRGRQETTGLAQRLDAARRKQEILDQELANLEEGLEKQVVSRNRVLALRRKAAEYDGEVADLRARLASSRDTVAELKAQRRLPWNRHRNQVSEQLQAVQGRLADLQEKIYAAEDVLRRTRITAPLPGRVVDLRGHTAGGVIQPAQILMDLLPEDDRLIVRARVHPRDMDAVFPGMPARIMLTAFNARTAPSIKGTLRTVSADRLVDDETGAAYFSAQIEVAEDAGVLKPGMQAEVFLVTGERTVMDYVLEPVVRSFSRAGREF